ncbi:Snf7-domain-containing protein [Schizophyllum commune H4-8]|uniref:Snf7-domain-containing protein n=1 Tax=Schizophyllum commune (strain H4-8 / FGSC 9210) TaxID=578458 RepID=UPI00215F139F|nr:Snf7-domain-containing protein [Schizophyllum commune H4-8]KAI5893835.1 Snf7-domain-containing protein [Schizophyllum commune H4-8]
MSGLMGLFGARRDPKQSARDAIVGLRQHLQMIEKKEEFLQKKIEEELKKAKANAVSNKPVATAALKRKQMAQSELDRLGQTRLQLEMQVNTLENANLNAETMQAMKQATKALKDIHGNLSIDKVDATMAEINEQRELANEVADAISNTANLGLDIDEDELAAELGELEQEQLDERLVGAEHVPLHLPPGAAKAQEPAKAAVEDDEEAQLRELQASMAI